MEEFLTVEEFVEKLDDDEKRKIPRIFYIHIALTLVIIIGALALIGFTGYYFYKAETVMVQYDAKWMEYNGDIYKFHLIEELQVLQNEHEAIKGTAVRYLGYLLLYCVVSIIVIHLFHSYINENHWYYDEDVLRYLRKQGRKKK